MDESSNTERIDQDAEDERMRALLQPQSTV
jgi:hypothetical protein